MLDGARLPIVSSPGCMPFVILFNGRTGSSHLTELLRSHPEIRARGERLGREARQGRKGQGDQLAWARETLEPRRRLRAVGFKTKLSVIDDAAGFADLLRERDVRVVHMERRNVIKAAVSAVNASRLRSLGLTSNLREGVERPEYAPISEAELRERIENREHWSRELSSFVAGLGLETLEIAYEDLLTDERGTVDRVLAFLEVPPAPLKSPVRKLTPDDLHVALPNFDELRAAFAGTPYEPMFDEVLVPAA